MSVRAQFVEAAREMVGTPFHWYGRLPGVGIDCSGLIIEAAKEVGIQFSFNERYSRANQVEVMKNALEEHCDPVEGDLEPGDILVCPVVNGPGHLLIYAGNTVIHASSSPSIMRVVEQPFDESFEFKHVCAYRLRVN